MPEKCTYKVTSPIKHNGERYAIGDAIELTEKEAERLRASGSIGKAVIVEVIIQQPEGAGKQPPATGGTQEQNTGQQPEDEGADKSNSGSAAAPEAEKKAQQAPGKEARQTGKKGNK